MLILHTHTKFPGYITTCYPTEADKGKYIATSWVLNAMGSVVGAAIVLGVTINNTTVSGVPSSVYIIFICLECVGLLLAGLLLDPSKLRRNDGRPIASFAPLPWYQELQALGLTLLEPKMALITLSIFSSEMYLSLTGAFNAWYFNARTRSLANVSISLPVTVSSRVLTVMIVLLLDLASFGGPRHCLDL